jgi:hypothetical protein
MMMQSPYHPAVYVSLLPTGLTDTMAQAISRIADNKAGGAGYKAYSSLIMNELYHNNRNTKIF